MRSNYLVFVLCVIGLSFFLLAAVPNVPSHLDQQNLPYGCGTCHVGFNFGFAGGSDACLSCHGNPSRRPMGFVTPSAKLQNLESEFKKTYRHPTFDVSGVHKNREILPETDPKIPRHADCADCHNVHYVTPTNIYAGLTGKRVGNVVADITKEFELCYKCHAESANLPGRFTNKRAEFSITNPSYHPVEAEGKSTAVISLIKPYKEKKVNPGDIAVIGCADCHGSDSSSSPRGPHGSNYEHILVDNYSTRDNQAESPFTYALCYRCHNRTSILGNESFRFHSLHIQGKGGAVTPTGTSCYTCHNSHGSLDNKYLIKFNTAIVSPNSRGMLKFVEKGVSTFRGECYLTCHGVDHNPKSY